MPTIVDYNPALKAVQPPTLPKQLPQHDFMALETLAYVRIYMYVHVRTCTYAHVYISSQNVEQSNRHADTHMCMCTYVHKLLPYMPHTMQLYAYCTSYYASKKVSER